MKYFVDIYRTSYSVQCEYVLLENSLPLELSTSNCPFFGLNLYVYKCVELYLFSRLNVCLGYLLLAILTLYLMLFYFNALGLIFLLVQLLPV